MFSAFNPSKCTHLEQWAADCAAPGEQSWISCRSRDLNPQPWVTSGFKSNALSVRPTTAVELNGLLWTSVDWCLNPNDFKNLFITTRASFLCLYVIISAFLSDSHIHGQVSALIWQSFLKQSVNKPWCHLNIKRKCTCRIMKDLGKFDGLIHFKLYY